MSPVEVDGLVLFIDDGRVRAEVKASCGHVLVEDVWTGPAEFNGSFTAGVEEDLVLLLQQQEQWCRDCRAAGRNLLTTAVVAVNGWPDLEGSPKQVRWATSIRFDKVAGLHQYMASVPFSDAWQAEIVARLMQVTQAHWWIELRDDTPWRVVLTLLSPTDFT